MTHKQWFNNVLHLNPVPEEGAPRSREKNRFRPILLAASPPRLLTPHDQNRQQRRLQANKTGRGFKNKCQQCACHKLKQTSVSLSGTFTRLLINCYLLELPGKKNGEQGMELFMFAAKSV